MKTDGLSPVSRLARKVEGTILVFALVLIAGGALVMAGWVYVMGTVAESSDILRQDAERRLRLENSRSMAVQYVREIMSTNTSTNLSLVAVTTATWSGRTLGGFTPSSGTTANPLVTAIPAPNTTITNLNVFSPAGVTSGGVGFFRTGTPLSFSLSDGQTTVNWVFNLRARAPMAGYDTVNLPLATIPSQLAVSGTATFGSTGGPVTSGGTLLNVAPPPDLPLARVTPTFSPGTSVSITSTGTRSGTNFSGTYSWSGTSTRVLTISLASTDSVRYSISQTVAGLTFTGSRNSDLPIDVSATMTSTGTITIPRGNTRALNIDVIGSGTIRVVYSGSGTAATRANFDLTASRLEFPSGTFTGGLYFSNNPTTQGGTASFARDLNTSGTNSLESAAPRRAWVEMYRND